MTLRFVGGPMDGEEHDDDDAERVYVADTTYEGPSFEESVVTGSRTSFYERDAFGRLVYRGEREPGVDA